MKKINPGKQLAHDQLGISRHRKKLARLKIIYDPSKRMRQAPASWASKKSEKTILAVPESMCLDNNYQETAKFYQSIRKNVATTSRQVVLNFEDCTNIKPTALLLLLAEVHRARLLRGPHVLTGTYPRNTKLLRRMCAMGFFNLIGIKSPLQANRTFPVEYIKFRSGTRLVPKSAKALRESLLGEGIQMDSGPRRHLQRGVSEAMLNALQHAYPHNAIPHAEVRNRWWLCGHYHQPTKKLSIMFCDLGVGIPRTLPRRYTWEKIRQALSIIPGVSADDGQMIKAGMHLGRTRTNAENRGKGLNDLRHFIDQAAAGDMQIFSKKGYYQYTGDGKESHDTKDIPLEGTLIKWSVPIDRVVSNWTETLDA